MTNTVTKTYLIGVIERAIAYCKVEAEDARTAAENWQEGEFHDRDDEALESEGPFNVRIKQPDGAWVKLPRLEWDTTASKPVAATVQETSARHTPEPWWIDDDGFIASGSGDDYVTVADPHVRPPTQAGEEQAANARRIVAAVNACQGISTEALERGGMRTLQEALQRAEFYYEEALAEQSLQRSLKTTTI